MFTEDDTSTEVVVLQDQTLQQQVSFLLILDIPLNIRVKNVIIPSLLLQRIINLYMALKASMFPSTLNNSIDSKPRAGRRRRR